MNFLSNYRRVEKTCENQRQNDIVGVSKPNNLWEEYRYRKAANAWRSFYFLKETSSLKACFKTKLNGYIGYLPVLTSSSQV